MWADPCNLLHFISTGARQDLIHGYKWQAEMSPIAETSDHVDYTRRHNRLLGSSRQYIWYCTRFDRGEGSGK